MNSRKINVGCGRNIKEGWINADICPLPGVDVVADFDRCADVPLPLQDDCMDEFLLSHLIEHLRHPLPFMQELHRIAAPGAKATVHVPYGSSDDAWEDPTHVRPYFLNSFAYFSQPHYWRADYGYRGDWRTDKIYLLVDTAECQGIAPDELLRRVMKERNFVKEMVVEMYAIKPPRAADQSLQTGVNIEFVLI